MKEIKEIIQSSNPKNPNSDKMKGWEIKKLGEVCKVIAGQSPEGKFYNSDGNGLPFYQGKKDYGEKYIGEPTTWTTKVTKEALANDILMSVRAPVGPINFATQKICIGRGLAAIRATKLIDKEFLFNFLLKHENEIVGNTGAVFNSINKAQIEAIEIPLPPLPEQQRIVSILDECFSAIDKAKANAEQNLKNAKEVFESYLQGVFGGSTGSPTKRDGWEEKKLGEIALIKGGKRVPKGYKLEYENTNHPYIRVTDFNDYGSIDLNDIRYVNDNVFNEIKNYTISKNDLYLSIAGTIGKTGIVPDELDGANLTENACKLVFKENIDKKFVYYFTKTESFKIQTGLNTRTAAMPKLALTRLASIKFHVPKLIQTQNDFVQKFDAISAETQKLEAVYQKKLDDLEELKKSVLKRAFAGEL